MKQVGVREAQVNLTKLLNTLPFSITRFGKEIAVVVQPSEVGRVTVTANPVTVTLEPTIQELRKVIDNLQTVDELPKEIWGTIKARCNFCSTSPSKMMLYKYTDGSGEGETLFCKKCWDKYEENQTGTKIYPSSNYIPAKQAVFSGFTPLSKPPKKEKKKK